VCGGNGETAENKRRKDSFSPYSRNENLALIPSNLVNIEGLSGLPVRSAFLLVSPLNFADRVMAIGAQRDKHDLRRKAQRSRHMMKGPRPASHGGKRPSNAVPSPAMPSHATAGSFQPGNRGGPVVRDAM
jgi:hypothetical protein